MDNIKQKLEEFDEKFVCQRKFGGFPSDEIRQFIETALKENTKATRERRDNELLILMYESEKRGCSFAKFIDIFIMLIKKNYANKTTKKRV